jgi:hypothetical protein
MIPIFPEWSDLGGVSRVTNSAWEAQVVRIQEYMNYFDGSVFQRPVELALPGEEPPLMFPVGLNLVKMMCIAQTDAAFGEWDEQIVTFGVRKDEEVDNTAKEAVKLLNKIMAGSNANSLLWEIELDRNVMGMGVVKVSPALSAAGRIKWTRIHPINFYPVWDPDDPNELLEAYIVIDMTREQAQEKYGITIANDKAVRVEHWTREKYTNQVQGKTIQEYSGQNPWGFVPFVVIPRLRTTNWYGDALTADILPVQDEVNARVADIGEALNYNAHPVRWAVNLPKSFNAKNFPLAPNALWDLGRVIGSSPEPKVGILQAEHAVQPEAFEHIKFLYDWARTSSFAPPIVFGEDNGGGQRSGETLSIRMMPLIRAVRRSRAYAAEGYMRLIKYSGAILRQKSFSDMPSRAVQRLVDGEIIPQFADVMPRDHQQIVDEVVKLMSTMPPQISVETAQKILGRSAGEPERIKADLQDAIYHPPVPAPEQKSNDTQEATKGKMVPQPKKPE